MVFSVLINCIVYVKQQKEKCEYEKVTE